MHNKYRTRIIDSLLVMKESLDDALINQVRTIGVTATATDCAALVDRIDALIRPV
jgi:hypothetical protein